MRPLKTLAHRALGPEDPADANKSLWRAVSRGMFEYRLGNFDDAAGWLATPAQTEDRSSPRTTSRQATALCFLTMAEHRRGRADASSSVLEWGSQIFASDGPDGGSWFPFYDWITGVEVRRQAERLIGGGTPVTGRTKPLATTQPTSPPR